MKKSLKFCLLLVLPLVLAANVPASVMLWIPGGVSADWHDPTNWADIGGAGHTLPQADDHVILGHFSEPAFNGPPWPVISTDVGVITYLTPGWWGNSVDPPTLEVTTGGFIVVAGFTRLSNDEQGPDTTTLNMTGGAMVTGALEVAFAATSTAQVNIDAGWIHAGVLTFGPGVGNIDLEEGTFLYLNNDVCTDVEAWIDAGLITGANGTLPVACDYKVTHPDLTAVYVIPEPATMVLLALGGVMLRRRK